MWSLNSLIPECCSRVFRAVPKIPIWKWAEENVFLDSQQAAAPGFYDSSKTPWTRRIQELMTDQAGTDPAIPGPPTPDKVCTDAAIMKSSQSGFTEGILNVIRWLAKFSPRNVIYAIDSADEAAAINGIRLEPTLRQLGEDVFTSDDDDVKRYILKLRRMIVWFFGSYSAGKFANKQASLLVADELEEYPDLPGDTSVETNLDSRRKTAEDGRFFKLSKPKLFKGPIHRAYLLGTQEKWHVPCPHCGTFQELVWERVRFSHCKDILGEWDKTRVLNETWYECANVQGQGEAAKGCRIEEISKPAMNARGKWIATNPNPTPGHVSQHFSDLYSMFKSVTWGRLALKCIAADASGMPSEKQGFWNHNLGLPWQESASRVGEEDVLNCRSAYRRGTIPFEPEVVLLTSDIGQSHARWVKMAFAADGEAWLIDWGSELSPDGVVPLLDVEIPCSNGKNYQVGQAGMDGKYRKEEVYAACLSVPGRMWPMAGDGSAYTRQSISFGPVSKGNYPTGFGLLTFNDRDFKGLLYREKLKMRRAPLLHLPEDITNELIKELTNEHLLQAKDVGVHAAAEFVWKRTGANHWGDCIKNAYVLWTYLKRGQSAPVAAESPPESGQEQ